MKKNYSHQSNPNLNPNQSSPDHNSKASKSGVKRKLNLDSQDTCASTSKNAKFKLPNIKELEEQKQIVKSEIVEMVQKLFGIKPDKKVLADINEDGINFIGRASVFSSSSKQQRHTTPVKYIEHLLSKIILRCEDTKEVLTEFTRILSLYTPLKQGGLAIDVAILEKVKSETHAGKYVSRSMNMSGKDKVFISPAHTKYVKKIVETPTGKTLQTASQDYKDGTQKFAQTYINQTAEKVNENDENTKIIFAEILGRMIITLFSQRDGAVYPEEGNARSMQIRHYQSENESDKFELLNVYQLKNLVEAGQSIKGQIRFVENSGNEVKFSAQNLDNLAGIWEYILINQTNLEEMEHLILEYNRLDADISLYSKNGSEYVQEYGFNEPLTKQNVEKAIQYHVAKQMFRSFDYRPLEEFSIVSATAKNRDFQAHKNSKGDKLFNYKFADGKEHRELKVSEALGYNDKVVFRNEETDRGVEYSLGKLKSAVVQHVILPILTHQIFLQEIVCQKIIHSFAHLVAADFAIENAEEFEKDIKSEFVSVTQVMNQTDEYSNAAFTDEIDQNIIGEGSSEVECLSDAEGFC